MYLFYAYYKSTIGLCAIDQLLLFAPTIDALGKKKKSRIITFAIASSCSP